MNIGNVATVVQAEVKNQNSVFGKFEFSVDKLQSNANENLNSGNGISLGDSVFKNLLLNSKALNNQVPKGNITQKEMLKVESLELEPSLEETNMSVGSNPNGMIVTPLEIQVLMTSNSANTVRTVNPMNNVSPRNENAFKPVQATAISGNVEILETGQPAEKPDGFKIHENEKNGLSNSTFVKIAKDKNNQMEMPANGSEAGTPVDGSEVDAPVIQSERKELNQERQAYLKETDLRGIERAAFSNNKEINLAKSEILTAIKEKKDEKPAGIENGETISNMNKPGNLVNDPIEMAFKSQKLDNVPVYNQIAEEIGAKLEQKGPMEFKLQLKPENLGEIDVSIKILDGKLSIDIISANSKTQDMLVSQVDKLIAKLGLQNFHVENLQVIPAATNTSQDTTSQSSLINLGMNFSDRRQQETLKDQSELRKSLRAISSLNAIEKQANNSMGMVQGKNYSGHKINYSF